MSASSNVAPPVRSASTSSNRSGSPKSCAIPPLDGSLTASQHICGALFERHFDRILQHFRNSQQGRDLLGSLFTLGLTQWADAAPRDDSRATGSATSTNVELGKPPATPKVVDQAENSFVPPKSLDLSLATLTVTEGQESTTHEDSGARLINMQTPSLVGVDPLRLSFDVLFAKHLSTAFDRLREEGEEGTELLATLLCIGLKHAERDTLQGFARLMGTTLVGNLLANPKEVEGNREETPKGTGEMHKEEAEGDQLKRTNSMRSKCEMFDSSCVQRPSSFNSSMLRQQSSGAWSDNPVEGCDRKLFKALLVWVVGRPCGEPGSNQDKTLRNMCDEVVRAAPTVLTKVLSIEFQGKAVER